MTNDFIIILGIILGILIVLAVLKNTFTPQISGPHYKLGEMLTKNERDCFKHLVTIFPEYYIAPQVSMGALLVPNVSMGVKDKYGKSLYHVLRGKIQSNRIDFVMLNKELQPVFIVELDDNSHNNKQEQDNLRDSYLKGAGLKTVRFRRNKGMFPPRAYFEKALATK